MIEKVIDEAISAQKEIVNAIDRYRFSDFKLEHARDFVKSVERMKVSEGQSDEAFQLYRKSVLVHYEALVSLTDSITPFESAFLEWMQTPSTLQILYELDPSFRESVIEFAKMVDECDDILSLEAMRIVNGFYGVTSAKDFAAIPGSTYCIMAKIAERTSIDKNHKKAILSANSWGLTSYIFGNEFLRSFKEKKDFKLALEREKDLMKSMLLEPVKTQAEIMEQFGFRSFRPSDYFTKYMQNFRPVVEQAIDSVHLANIVMLPTHVGDIGHHIGWQYYYICRDEINMELLRVHLNLLQSNLIKAYENGVIKSVFDVTSTATAISALYLYKLLEDEGFTADMIVRLFTERFYNYIQRKQFERNVVNELHINDFLDFIHRGERLSRDKRMSFIEWDALNSSKVLNSPELYAFPFCAITTKFAALMKFADMPCLLAPEPVSIISLVNAVALNPEVDLVSKFCKGCATASLQPNKCLHCMLNQNIFI
ncbi:Uncharacterized protein conserved in archaea [Archaeoglobus sulfaticallidus PM70-1]|uniref:Uncharacterized protein conserved in archaea n=1 Tax=Archaeoglobus sulfaticallidus PM70-1 TaxID=387631 RepID=N0BJH1_9EURY|nr:DUF2193 domain-containing protein [Archaeoglobus sulfaticallidus]AGK60621.1 Uncharacterized protein conserved in archaea [Archaeoglobus sulfaticallidus PM70-1]